MADITMCNGRKFGVECPLKNTCYRHTANANPYRQSYFCEAPFETGDSGEVTCTYYCKTEGE